MPYLFWGQKVKGQGHNALIVENGLCRIISFSLHLSSWNFTHRLPMSRGCALFILGSKGQRSRSQCIDYRKRFMSHDFFPFTPIIMKLHTQTPHESRICPTYLGSKGQRSRSQCIDYRKRFMSHNFFLFTPIIIKLHTQTPHESRMCPIYFGVKRSKVKVTMHWL